MALNRFRLGLGGGGGSTNSPTIHPLVAGLPAGSTFTRASGVWTPDFEGTLKTVGNNVPAFTGARLVDASTWSALDTGGTPIADATLLGYLSEPAATNSLLHSQAFDNAYWFVGGSAGAAAPVVTANSTDVTDPEGGYNAEKIVFDAVSSAGQYSIVSALNSLLTSNDYSLSVDLRTLTGTADIYLFSTNDLGEWHTQPVHVTTEWTTFHLGFTTGAINAFHWAFGQDLVDPNQTAKPAQTVYAYQAGAVQGTRILTSPIPTTSGTASRAGTIANIPMSKVTAAKGAVELTVTPSGAGQTGVIWSSYVDADNYTEIAATATTIVINKRVAATTYTATATYTHAADTALTVKAAWDDVTGLFVKVDSGTAGTHANTTAAQLKADNTCQVGTRNGGSYFVGNFRNLKFYARKPSSWS